MINLKTNLATKNPMKIQHLLLLIVSTFNFQPSALLAQGTLTPPGAPAPAMKTLTQIEPRAPISSLPFVVTISGAYYLTTNLTGVSGTNGITIAVQNVTLDLNGFTLTGVAGASNGITTATTFGWQGITVRNGKIFNWPGAGVNVSGAEGAQLEELTVKSCGQGGIVLGGRSTIANCISETSVGVGITAGTACQLINCLSVGNSGYGIICARNCVLNNCLGSQNSGGGIGTDVGCTLSACSAYANLGTGINVNEASIIKDCSVFQNNTDGILARRGSVISGCLVVSNSSNGLNLFDNCTVANCTITGNTSDGIDGDPANTINGCTVVANGNIGIYVLDGSSVLNCTVKNNLQEGIDCTSYCAVTGNNCSLNGNSSGKAGIHATGSYNRLDSNHSIQNGYGLLVDTVNGANVVVRNSCVGNTADISIASGNKVGPTVSDPSSASANPWANFFF